MSVTLALVVGGLTSVGVYLITSRSLTRMPLGCLLGHAAVVALLAAGGEAGERPISGDEVRWTNCRTPSQAFAPPHRDPLGLTLFLLVLPPAGPAHGRRSGRGRSRRSPHALETEAEGDDV